MNLNIDFFHIVNESVAEKGRVLISEPFLRDNYFRRSVVYLTEHNEDGSLGFVLNKPVDIRIEDIVTDFEAPGFTVSVGGPVSNNTLHYIHTRGTLIPESIPVANGISWGGDFEVVKDLIQRGEIRAHELRFFLGYSGWAAKQLDGELKDNAWLVGKLSSGLVMQSADPEFWSNTLAGYSNKYKAWANFPEDPGLN
ncbi:MAG: YqgE/AlgH family protein [Bacteroidales bacterium]